MNGTTVTPTLITIEATGHNTSENRGLEEFQYKSRRAFRVDLPNLLKTWVTFLHTSSTGHHHKRSSQTNEIKLKTKIEAPLYNTINTIATIIFSGSLARSEKTCPSLFRVVWNLIANFRLLMLTWVGNKQWTIYWDVNVGFYAWNFERRTWKRNWNIT